MSARRSLTAAQVAAIKDDGVHWVAPSLYMQVREVVAKVLRTRYVELRQQTELTPGDVLDRLNESVVSSSAGLETAASMQASFAILAHFFESCDIFEDSASKVPA